MDYIQQKYVVTVGEYGAHRRVVNDANNAGLVKINYYRPDKWACIDTFCSSAIIFNSYAGLF